MIYSAMFHLFFLSSVAALSPAPTSTEPSDQELLLRDRLRQLMKRWRDLESGETALPSSLEADFRDQELQIHAELAALRRPLSKPPAAAALSAALILEIEGFLKAPSTPSPAREAAYGRYLDLLAPGHPLAVRLLEALERERAEWGAHADEGEAALWRMVGVAVGAAVASASAVLLCRRAVLARVKRKNSDEPLYLLS
jgi:hypothetical protein